MARKQEKATDAPAKLYRREQIISMKQYADREDLLIALLRPDRRYALADVDAQIDRFMKGKVK